MSLYPPKPSSSTSVTTEFDILKASHKFLREEDQDTADTQTGSWNDQLAQKYYDSLFREFAVCELKHYKSGNFALRWRTEAEVLSGAGENTCGNTRCKHHDTQDAAIHLNTLELPFAYEEHGNHKSALVKVVLCPRCLKKLMWKRNKEKATGQAAIPLDGSVEPGDGEGVEDEADDMRRFRRSKGRTDDKRESMTMEPGPSTRRRTSRSRSPRRNRNDNDRSRRRRSTSR